MATFDDVPRLKCCPHPPHDSVLYATAVLAPRNTWSPRGLPVLGPFLSLVATAVFAVRELIDWKLGLILGATGDRLRYPLYPFAAGLKARMHVKSASVRIVENHSPSSRKVSRDIRTDQNREGDDGQEPRQRAQTQKSEMPKPGLRQVMYPDQPQGNCGNGPRCSQLALPHQPGRH